MSKKLNSGQINLLQLVVKGANEDGWASVGRQIYPLVEKLPKELVQIEKLGNEGKGRIRLTENGKMVVYSIDWLIG